ncbi:LysR family transcriptional regulator [Allorhizobium pseudoryzae]|uniref:LysR family transcriptional regulator n=1 Tax=Allorhizobium pseudoryzae TaxID=379684 RepID=UPI003D03865A
MESIRALKYFVTAARLQNVTAAARDLNVSQSAVSSAISKLEEEFGITLFERQGIRGINLTAEGGLFRDRAELLLIQAEDFATFAQNLKRTRRPEIHAGCYRTLAARFMPELLSRLSRSERPISIQLSEGSQFKIISDLLEGRTSIAIGYDFDVSDTLIETTILTESKPHVLVAEDHALAGRSGIYLREIAEEPFLLLDEPYSHQYYLGLFKISGIKPNIGFKSESHDLVRGMVARSHGFTFHNSLPQTSVLYDGSRIRVLRLLDELPPLRVNLFSLRTSSSRPEVRQLVEFIKANFRQL